jgi:hypothetical protein
LGNLANYTDQVYGKEREIKIIISEIEIAKLKRIDLENEFNRKKENLENQKLLLKTLNEKAAIIGEEISHINNVAIHVFSILMF